MGRSLGFVETATAAMLIRSTYETYIIPFILTKMTNAALKKDILTPHCLQIGKEAESG